MNICSRSSFKYIFILFVCGSLILGYLLLANRHEQDEAEADKQTWGVIANQLDEYYFKHVQNDLKYASLLKETVEAVDSTQKEAGQKILQLLTITFPRSTAYIMDEKGNVISSTPYNSKGDSYTGENYAYSPYFSNLKSNESFVYPAVVKPSEQTGLFFSRRIQKGDRFIGAIVLQLNIDDIIRRLKNADGVNVALMTPDGIIFASSDNRYLFKTFFKISEERLKEIKQSKQFAGIVIEQIGIVNREVLTIAGIPYTYKVINAGYSGWKLLIFKKKSYYELPLHELVLFSLVALLAIVLMCIVLISCRYSSGNKAEEC